MTEPSPIIAPRLGIVTSLCLTACVVILLLLCDREFAEPGYDRTTVTRLTAIGVLFGLVGAIRWMLTAVGQVVVQCVACMLAAIVAGYVQFWMLESKQLGVDYFIRCVINFGGLMISQTALFLLLRLPAWQRKRSRSASSRRIRFSIGGILMLTLCVAVMLALAGKYQPPRAMTGYWPWLVTIWILFPITSAGAVWSQVHRRPSRHLAVGISALSLASCLAMLLAYAEAKNGLAAMAWRVNAFFYGILIIASMLVMAAISYAGRLDAIACRLEETDEAPTKEPSPPRSQE